MTDVDLPIAAAPLHRRRRQRGVLGVAVVFLLLLAVTGVVALRSRETDPFASERKLAVQQLVSLGAPAGFSPAPRGSKPKSKPEEPRYDTWSRTASAQYDNGAGAKDIAGDVDRWLTGAGFPRSTGEAAAQTCGTSSDSTAKRHLWACGNFLRASSTLRVWVEFFWAGVPAHVGPPPPTTRVSMIVNVQPRLPLARALAVPRLEDGSLAAQSPGFDAVLAPGEVRTLIDWIDDDQRTLYHVAFDAEGQLIMGASFSVGHGPSSNLPSVLPVRAGGALRQLIVGQWPTLPTESSPSSHWSTSGTGGFVGSMSTAQAGHNGDLWLLDGRALRRFTSNGDTINIMGGLDAPPRFDEPRRQPDAVAAVGQRPQTRFGSGFAVGADGAAWLADRDGLIQVRNGIATVLDRRKVISAVSDGDNGVYFATDTQVFHRRASGRTELLAGNASGGRGAGAATSGATFAGLHSMALGADGSVFVVGDKYLYRIRSEGSVTRIAGSGKTPGDDCAPRDIKRASDLTIDLSSHVAASPLGGVFIEWCEKVIQIGY